MPSTSKEIHCWLNRNIYSISKLLQAFGLTPVRKTKTNASCCQGQGAIKSFPDIKYETKGTDSKSLSSKLKSWNWNKKLNIHYFKNRQNDASDLKSRKDASAESSGVITSSVQTPNRGNACISVTFFKKIVFSTEKIFTKSVSLHLAVAYRVVLKGNHVTLGSEDWVSFL